MTKTNPKATRPHFPPGYIENAKELLEWGKVEQMLEEAKNYWLCTVRPDGRPHAVPKWGVWLNDRVYFDGSSETRHARNIAANPQVVVHLESGDQVVIIEGICTPSPRPSSELGQALARGYARKYAAFNYSPRPDQWDNGGLYEVAPQTVLAWTKFTDDPTKFTLE